MSTRRQRGVGTLSYSVWKALAPAPRDFTDASWVKVGGMTVNANVATDPDGTSLADALVGTSSLTRTYREVLTDPSNRSFRLGVYLKAPVAHTVYLAIIARNASNGTLDEVVTAFTADTNWTYREVTKTFSSLSGAAKVHGTIYVEGGAGLTTVHAYNGQFYEDVPLGALPASVPAESVIVATASGMSDIPLLGLLQGSY